MKDTWREKITQELAARSMWQVDNGVLNEQAGSREECPTGYSREGRLDMQTCPSSSTSCTPGR